MSLHTHAFQKMGLGQTLEQPKIDQYQNQMVSQGLPSLTELARAGRIYTANTGTGTAIAPVTAMPTTAAQHSIYNSATANTHLLIIKVGM